MEESGHNPAVLSRAAVAAWLVAARSAAGVTQARAAHEIGTTVTSVSRWETGTHAITAEDFLMLARIYNAGDALASLVNAQRATGHIATDVNPEDRDELLRDAEKLAKLRDDSRDQKGRRSAGRKRG